MVLGPHFGVRDLREALLGPSPGPGRPGDLPARGCFTSTPRGGALSPAGGPLPGSGSLPSSGGGDTGVVLPPRTGATTRRRVGAEGGRRLRIR